MANVSDFRSFDVAVEQEQTRTVHPTLPPVSPALLQASRPGGAKRMLDILGAGMGLILLSPLLLLVSLAVYALQGGPVVISHRRVGYAGRCFSCFKFRSMATDADTMLRRHLDANPEARREWETSRKLKDDPRITPLGYVLRKTSMDELPQLLNVLCGEMSLVGPRPIVFDEAIKYGDNIVDYLCVRPGLTGMWQVNGRSDVSYSERVALDVSYSRTRSFNKDVGILFKTIHVMLGSKGSY
jgi:exopolysaccharide production protein ExoY